MIRLRNRYSILSALAIGTLILLAGVLVAIRPALAQTSTDADCSTGTAVPNPSNNSGLVSDC